MTAVTPGRSTRSRRPRTTVSATPPTAAPSAPTAVATPTSSGSEPSRPPVSQAFELMSVSRNGGATWSRPAPVAGPVTQPGVLDPVQGRPVIDGVAGARSDLAPAPSVDIANGAPTGADATNRIVMTYVSGDGWTHRTSTSPSRRTGASHGRRRGRSRPRGTGACTPHPPSPPTAPTCTSCTTPSPPRSSTTTTQPRTLVGVVEHADSSTSGCRHRGVLDSASRRPRGPTRLQCQLADLRVPRRLRVRRRHP